jgi:hypothetical protein
MPYHNLANQTDGGESVENTANCYIVDKAGYYSLPLVYGNAVQNGEEVSAPYITVQDVVDPISEVMYLEQFLRHDGKPINAAYIYDNTGFASPVGDAAIVWMDAEGLIADVQLDEEKKMLLFNVPDFKPGNAVVALRDEAGAIMWSWHIWLTDLDVSAANTDAVTNFQGVTYNFMKHNLGWTGQLSGNQLHYQWGRKDPIPSSTVVFGEDYGGKSGNIGIAPAYTGTIPLGIANPHVFYPANGPGSTEQPQGDWNVGTIISYQDNVTFVKTGIRNLWSVENPKIGAYDDPVVKSVYDPSPVGFKMPASNAFTGATSNGVQGGEWMVEGEFAGGWNFYTNGGKTATAFFDASGYRDCVNGAVGGIGQSGSYWTALPGNAISSVIFTFSAGDIVPFAPIFRSYGLSVRPVTD